MGKAYINEEKGLNVVKALLAASAILQTAIDEDEARIEKLVMIESCLQRDDPTVSFEGHALDELLDAFVPRKANASHGFKALTHVEPDAQLAQAPAHALSPAPAQEPEDPQDTLQYWQGVWQSYRAKNESRQQEAAAVRRQPASSGSDDEDDAKRPLAQPKADDRSSASGKMPGSRRRTAGYQHHLPSGDKHLPNSVSKSRMQAITDAIREGRKYTQDERNRARARMVKRPAEVD
ncbi:hypothetical protein [Caenimonas koreensis]|uniref:hypothetical protein n=1 Tax=Caenimonas koreensis TaxID=367474 RepID=UPI003784C794